MISTQDLNKCDSYFLVHNMVKNSLIMVQQTMENFLQDCLVLPILRGISNRLLLNSVFYLVFLNIFAVT